MKTLIITLCIAAILIMGVLIYIHNEELKLNETEKQRQIYEFFSSTQTGDVLKVNALLQKAHGLVNERDYGNYTPVFRASSKEMIEFLIANGADVNARNTDGNTPLQVRIIERPDDIKSIEILISKGADVNAKDKTGYTALHWAVCKTKENVDTVKVLIENGADINIRGDNGKTALKIAVENGLNNIADLLRKHGAKE